MKKMKKILKAIFILPIVFVIEIIAVVILGLGAIIYCIALFMKNYKLAKELITNYIKNYGTGN